MRRTRARHQAQAGGKEGAGKGNACRDPATACVSGDLERDETGSVTPRYARASSSSSSTSSPAAAAAAERSGGGSGTAR